MSVENRNLLCDYEEDSHSVVRSKDPRRMRKYCEYEEAEKTESRSDANDVNTEEINNTPKMEQIQTISANQVLPSNTSSRIESNDGGNDTSLVNRSDLPPSFDFEDDTKQTTNQDCIPKKKVRYDENVYLYNSTEDGLKLAEVSKMKIDDMSDIAERNVTHSLVDSVSGGRSNLDRKCNDRDISDARNGRRRAFLPNQNQPRRSDDVRTDQSHNSNRNVVQPPKRMKSPEMLFEDNNYEEEYLQSQSPASPQPPTRSNLTSSRLQNMKNANMRGGSLTIDYNKIVTNKPILKRTAGMVMRGLANNQANRTAAKSRRSGLQSSANCSDDDDDDFDDDEFPDEEINSLAGAATNNGLLSNDIGRLYKLIAGLNAKNSIIDDKLNKLLSTQNTLHHSLETVTLHLSNLVDILSGNIDLNELETPNTQRSFARQY